ESSQRHPVQSIPPTLLYEGGREEARPDGAMPAHALEAGLDPPPAASRPARRRSPPDPRPGRSRTGPNPPRRAVTPHPHPRPPPPEPRSAASGAEGELHGVGVGGGDDDLAARGRAEGLDEGTDRVPEGVGVVAVEEQLEHLAVGAVAVDLA